MNKILATLKKYGYFVIISSSEASFYFLLNTLVGLISSFFHSKLGVSYMMMNLIISGVYQIISVILQPLLGYFSDIGIAVNALRLFTVEHSIKIEKKLKIFEKKCLLNSSRTKLFLDYLLFVIYITLQITQFLFQRKIFFIEFIVTSNGILTNNALVSRVGSVQKLIRF